MVTFNETVGSATNRCGQSRRSMDAAHDRTFGREQAEADLLISRLELAFTVLKEECETEESQWTKWVFRQGQLAMAAWMRVIAMDTERTRQQLREEGLSYMEPSEAPSYDRMRTVHELCTKEKPRKVIRKYQKNIKKIYHYLDELQKIIFVEAKPQINLVLLENLMLYVFRMQEQILKGHKNKPDELYIKVQKYLENDSRAKGEK